MKKFINDTANIEKETIQGLVKSFPDTLNVIENELVVTRKKLKQGKVAIIGGGGSGHDPMDAGFVGEGMFDGAVCGAIYTSPSVYSVISAIKHCDTGAGTLLLIKNYTGDIINFNMAKEECEDEGHKVEIVVVNDDVAVEDSTWTAGRRGVSGTMFVIKVAGAKAETGASLEEVKMVALKAIDNVRTMGVAISPCVNPISGIAGFSIGDDEMEVGIGVHGEPGVKKENLKPVNEIVDELLERILNDIDYSNSEVAVMVNGCGGTPLMELYIAYNHVEEVLRNKGIKIIKSYVGNYMTSMEMQGFALSLFKLDEETKWLLLAEANTPGLKA